MKFYIIFISGATLAPESRILAPEYREALSVAKEDDLPHEVEPYALTALAPLVPVCIFGPSQTTEGLDPRCVEGAGMMARYLSIS